MASSAFPEDKNNATQPQEEVRALARLALLPLSQEETERIAAEFSAIVEYVAILRSLSLPDGKEAGDVAGVDNVLRDDAAREVDPERSTLLVKAAARSKNGHIVVKQVLSYE
ncbi:aspartyl/glutamyl-tRNA amidotransferase subunit C [Candidatus Parcubacteria bacterium]|nr:MAG: aspartyl/glutamyl-tRNA amidotransferase subunit C [Candidatus Parcubacteria bacterium]